MLSLNSIGSEWKVLIKYAMCLPYLIRLGFQNHSLQTNKTSTTFTVVSLRYRLFKEPTITVRCQ